MIASHFVSGKAFIFAIIYTLKMNYSSIQVHLVPTGIIECLLIILQE